MKYIPTDELRLLQLNNQIDHLELFLKILVEIQWQLMLSQKRYRELEEDYNTLLHQVQLIKMYQMNERHLLRILAEDCEC